MALFKLLAGLSVLVPLILYFLAQVKMVDVLDRAMEWLMANGNTKVMVVLAVLGTQVIGQGTERF